MLFILIVTWIREVVGIRRGSVIEDIPLILNYIYMYVFNNIIYLTIFN